MTKQKQILFLLIALLSVLIGWSLFEYGLSFSQSVVAATTLGMAGLWISELIPIYATSLLPLIVFPLLGVIPMKELAPNYMNQTIFLFIGGFIMAYAMERSGLHRRIALFIIIKMGSSPAKLLLGFMSASFFLSMWILNTATVTMLLPAVLAVLSQLKKSEKILSTPLLLGIAYASSIGGMATIVGTLPNNVIVEHYERSFPDMQATHSLGFLDWMAIGLPLALILFTVAYFFLRFKYLKKSTTGHLETSNSELINSYEALGPMNFQEKWIAFLFSSMALLWLTMKPVEFASYTFPGWASLFAEPEFIKESTVAILFSLLLFIIPMPKDKALVTWKDVERLPVGIIFLFGAGFALVAGFKVTGLNIELQNSLSDMGQNIGAFASMLMLCFIMTFLTELTSNTTSTQLFAIVMVALAANFPEELPTYFLLPVTFCASCAFMLPVATPPNTIVFGSDKLRISDMIRTGLVLNIVCTIIITIYSHLTLS